jgi:hypothetical protein
MSNEDGAVTYNGEIYNHAGLRPELEQQGHAFALDAIPQRRRATGIRFATGRNTIASTTGRSDSERRSSARSSVE